MMPSAKQEKSNNPPPSLSKDSLDGLRKLIEDKFVSLEAHIVSLEDQMNKHYEQFIDMIKDIEQKANSALSLATSNSKVIAENTERISSQQFDYQSLVERIDALVELFLNDIKNIISRSITFNNKISSRLTQNGSLIILISNWSLALHIYAFPFPSKLVLVIFYKQ